MSQLIIKSLRPLLSVIALFFLSVMPLSAQTEKGTFEKITVHGSSLEGNLEGDNPDREVFVYLPPGYTDNPNKRYPVVYFLHGFRATAQMYVDFLGMPGLADEAIAQGTQQMIVVMPDAFTVYGGSFYSSSPTIGDWEGFIANDLVGYIDKNYRTIPDKDSRGLSGHSMGGYGTLRIGMKRPEVFGALFIMSAGALNEKVPPVQFVEEQITFMEQRSDDEAITSSLQTLSAAWAPNTQKPPYYFDWPYDEGEEQTLVHEKWAANSGIVMVDQYVPALKSYKAIYIDVGDEDGLSGSNFQLTEALSRLGVAHEFELYEGTHGNRVVQRFQKNVLPFFSEHLNAE